MSKVELDGYKVEFDAAVNLMDNEIREELHSQFQGNVVSDQEFLDAYIKAHAEKFDGEEFQVN